MNLTAVAHQDSHSAEFTLCGIPKEFIASSFEPTQPCPYCADNEELRSATTSSGYRRSQCAVPTCSRPAASKGMCHLHYERTKQTGDVRAEKPPRARTTWEPDTLCVVNGCVSTIYSRGLCRRDYVKWTKARKSLKRTETS